MEGFSPFDDLFYDPQTSGGLLIALPEKDALEMERNLPSAYRIGKGFRAAEKAAENFMIIIALDVSSVSEARALVSALGDDADFYKVGLELYAVGGMDFVRELKAQGKRVFLDLKLYDISEQVKRAVAAISAMNVDFLTIHAVKQVMKASVEGRSGSLKLLAVTVLTSFDENDIRDEGYALTLAEVVERRVGHAMQAGVDGIVCSSLEV